MSPNDEHPVLIAVAITIADGLPVDWESLFAQHPELAAELRSLRDLGRIETAERQIAKGL